MSQSIKFVSKEYDFFTTLNHRVNQYFKTKNISRNANSAMVFKTIAMFTLYFGPYALIVAGSFSSLYVFYALSAIMGFGLAGIGMSVMHDANHSAYSKKKWVNTLLGYSLNMVGGNAFNWKVQHNVLHHTFTNVDGTDEDIEPRGVLRFCPHTDWKPFHKFQFIYAWFFYGLLSFIWIVFKDFERLTRYKRACQIKKQKTTELKEWSVLIFTKIAYYAYIIVIPMLVLPFAWWHVLIGFFVMHYIAGFILAVVFQLAHVVEGTEYPVPDETGNIYNTWAVHQLHTTANFAQHNKLLSWYVGGLNYQVEHHLFSNICHVHYHKLSEIVKETSEEFGHPYKSKRRLRDAVASHFKVLKALGKKDASPVLEAVFVP
ncbi:MAG: fatty acid desaturase family protein [Imperialibacter sp.]|uniref:fatty acid desaturase family protein n=1 Tax=Imperialibacter sp. TaxID=2038411 RepID=UPI003A8886C5